MFLTDEERNKFAAYLEQCSGSVSIISQEQVTPPQMAKMLQEQGSDPEFFGIDENGMEIENEGDEDEN